MYDVLGFTRTIEPGDEDLGDSPENTLDSGYCYTSGLTDETVDGAYAMGHDWALDHVAAEQAIPRRHEERRDPAEPVGRG